MDRTAPETGTDPPCPTRKKTRFQSPHRRGTSPEPPSPAVPATPWPITPPDPPSKMPFRQKDELLRLTHDLSRARANLAHFRRKHAVATKFLEEIQCMSASCAGMIDTAQEINHHLDWSEWEWDKAGFNPNGVGSDDLNRLYHCSREARKLNEDGLTLCRKHCVRLEQAWKTFIESRDAIEREHCRLIGLRSHPPPEGSVWAQKRG
ncbi:hypothetical protein TCE0_056r18485 [Talaromyces pinophilus]|uniref:Uncharacterized protein n=1 Tax=Talaromyces pinophilus TaxID=128442 RepID=A0A0B8N5X3_TALPI|nr:hypothetical protein TCE0_056r18485 [Talaromyces pinophilus]